MDTEKLVADVLKNSQNDIKEKVKELIKENVTHSFYYAIKSQIDEMVTEFITTEMKDEIHTMLKDAKPALIEEMKKGFITVGAELSKALTAQALANLEIGSYKSKDIIKKIFD